MAASTMAPMAMAITPKDMMFEVRPVPYIGMKERMTAMGMVTMGMVALGMCHRKMRITRLTMMSSSMRVCLSVSIDRWMRSERS